MFSHAHQILRDAERRHRSLLAEAVTRRAAARPARAPRPSRGWLATFAVLTALIAQLS